MKAELLGVAMLLAPAAYDANLRGWRSVATPVRAEDLQCGNYSTAWRVATRATGVAVTAYDEEPVSDPLPFATGLKEPPLADRHVRRVQDGWLVGLDAGEFGGGLWQFAEDGSARRRVRPGPGAGHHPDDYLHAENVKGFATVGQELLVLMGLDHMTARSGRLFTAVVVAGEAHLQLRLALDGEPRAWHVAGDSLLVLTDTTLFRIPAVGAASVVHKISVDLSGLYPNSMVEVPDGTLYAGMRRFLIRLSPEAGYREKWFLRETCARFRIRGTECGRLAGE